MAAAVFFGRRPTPVSRNCAGNESSLRDKFAASGADFFEAVRIALQHWQNLHRRQRVEPASGVPVRVARLRSSQLLF